MLQELTATLRTTIQPCCCVSIWRDFFTLKEAGKHLWERIPKIPNSTFNSLAGYANGTQAVISSKDIQPTVPVPPPYPANPVQMQLPPGQSMPLVYDPGLINAVTNAQNFVNQTFSGARLLESHNVSSTVVKHRALAWGSIRPAARTTFPPIISLENTKQRLT